MLPKTGCDLWSSGTAVVMQCVPEGLPEGQEDLPATEQIPCASRQRNMDKTDPPGMKAMDSKEPHSHFGNDISESLDVALHS